jgi:hypothetical protein
MSSERRLDQAVGRLRAVVAGEVDAAGELPAGGVGAGPPPALLAERLDRLESRLDELARVLGGLDKALRAAPSTDVEAIVEQLRGELARERARRRRAAFGLLALALLAGAAGWLWGDALDLPGLREAVEERAAALVEMGRAWLGGV